MIRRYRFINYYELGSPLFRETLQIYYVWPDLKHPHEMNPYYKLNTFWVGALQGLLVVLVTRKHVHTNLLTHNYPSNFTFTNIFLLFYLVIYPILNLITSPNISTYKIVYQIEEIPRVQAAIVTIITWYHVHNQATQPNRLICNNQSYNYGLYTLTIFSFPYEISSNLLLFHAFHLVFGLSYNTKSNKIHQ